MWSGRGDCRRQAVMTCEGTVFEGLVELSKPGRSGVPLELDKEVGFW